MKTTNLNFSKGNQKLGKIMNFSLEPVRTCPCKCPFCYALKGNHLFPNVKEVRKENTDYMFEMERIGKLDNVATEIINAIKAKNVQKFRIHESGDLYSVEYAKLWFNVIKACPNTEFNIFTKAFDVVREVPFYQLKNASLFLSASPTTIIPIDLMQHYRIAWLKDRKGIETRIPDKAFICPGNTKKCENCGYCFNRKSKFDVAFPEH